jgi:hypothetical protein
VHKEERCATMVTGSGKKLDRGHSAHEFGNAHAAGCFHTTFPHKQAEKEIVKEGSVEV